MVHLLMLSTDLFYADPHIVHTIQQLIEVLGTIAFAIRAYVMPVPNIMTGLEDMYVVLPWLWAAERYVMSC